MNRTTKSLTITATTVLVWVTLFTLSATTWAADCSKPEKSEGEMSESTFADVQAAMELMSKNKTGEAIDKLTKMADKGSEYEKALINYNLGIAYSSKNDYPNATKAFAKSLVANGLPRAQREQVQYNLGQLYIVVGQYEDGIKTLQEYINNACGAVPAEAHIFLANALSEKKRYQEAVPQINLAISKAKEPKEQWLQMKLAINYELKDFKACAEALVQLIAKVPEKSDYWRQLSSVFYEMKEDAESVAVLALAERQGFIQKPNEIKNLYNVYMMLELPYKSGLLMQDAMSKNRIPTDEENLDLMANAWINARESQRAEAALKKLGAMSDKGDYYFKLGAMYGDNERWQESKEMLEKSLQKGGMKRQGDAWLRLAVAHYGLKDNPGAITALQKAITFPESSKQASEWLRALGGGAKQQLASSEPTKTKS
jgi:tetratricopeptide (TPR) repeat protein